MPIAKFGQELNIPKSESRYLKLKAKGDTIKFRLAGVPVYQTDHWINKEKISCDKYNSADNIGDCRYCDQYAEAYAAGDKTAMREYRPVTTFMYPVLCKEYNNKEHGRAAIFQFTAKSIHYGIDGYSRMGVDVFACDWAIERTEEQGNYYSVMRLGEGVLSKEEEAELKRAGGFELEGKESESVRPGEVPIEEYDETKK